LKDYRKIKKTKAFTVNAQGMAQASASAAAAETARETEIGQSQIR
jgi:hypothetical protein